MRTVVSMLIAVHLFAGTSVRDSFAGKRLREACDRDPEMGYALMKRLFELLTERLDATRLQVLRAHAQPEPAR